MSPRAAMTSPSGDSEEDLPLTESEIDELTDVIAKLYSEEENARGLLRTVRFPQGVVPGWGGLAINFWSQIFEKLDNGAMATPYRRVIAAALRVYPENEVLGRLQHEHADAASMPAAPAPAPPSAPPAQPGRARAAPAAPRPRAARSRAVGLRHSPRDLGQLGGGAGQDRELA